MLETARTTQPLMALFCSFCAGLLTLSFFLTLRRTAKDGFTYLKRLHQIPCSRCAFFTGDYRLKCTVHPCQALTEDAIACLDFEPLGGSSGSFGTVGRDRDRGAARVL